MSKLETNQVDPATGTTLTLGTSGDTIAIPSGVTIANSGTDTGFGGTNTPAFLANYTSTQTLANATATKVQFNSELFDTNSDYDNSSNYRFTPTVAGKYVVGLKIKYNNSQSCRIFSIIYKNGSEYERSEKWSDGSGTDLDPLSVTIINFNGSSDYVEAFALQESGGNLDTNASISTRAYFYAYRVLE